MFNKIEYNDKKNINIKFIFINYILMISFINLNINSYTLCTKIKFQFFSRFFITKLNFYFIKI